MYINLTTLVLAVVVLFEEKINRMGFTLELSDKIILITLAILMIFANRDWIKSQRKKFRRTPKILGVRNRFYREPPLFSMAELERLAIQREKRESAQKKYDELYERAFGEKPEDWG